MKKILTVCAFLATALAARATTYYVSNAGSDSNAGTSTSTPWATVAKVNAASLAAGDVVSFQCGGIWRDHLVPKSGSSTSKVTYNSYGTGSKPLFLGSLAANTSGQWTSLGGNIWSLGGNTSTNLLINTNFTTDVTTGWTFEVVTTNGASATAARTTGTFHGTPASAAITVSNNGTAFSEVKFKSNALSITAGKKYRLKFWAKASTAITLADPQMVRFSDVTTSYASAASSWGSAITTDWTYHQIDYTAGSTQTDAMVYFRLGNITGLDGGAIFYLDDVTFQEVNSVLPMEIGSISFNNPSYIDNPSFTTDDAGWVIYANAGHGAVATKARTTGTYDSAPAAEAITVTNNGTTGSSVQFYRDNLSVSENVVYRLQFRAKASTAFTMGKPEILKQTTPWSAYYSGTPAWSGPTGNGNITTSWTTYMIDFTANTTANDARLDFMLGAAPDGAVVYLDDIMLTERTDNLSVISNPSFASDTSGWTLSKVGSATGTLARNTTVYDSAPASGAVNVTNPGGATTDIQLYTQNLSITSGKVYRLSYRARATAPFTMAEPDLMKQSSPWTNYASATTGFNGRVTTNWMPYSVDFTANTTAADAEIMIWLGASVPDEATFYIDNISFKEVYTNPSVDLTVQNANMAFKKRYYTDPGSGAAERYTDAGSTIPNWVTSAGDFFWDLENNRVLMYATANPATQHATIECAQTMEMCEMVNKSYIEINGLAFWHGAGDGVQVFNGNDILVTNCDLRYIGGGVVLGWGESVRFGNAIQLWLNAHDVTITNNYMLNIYDAGISNQGTTNNDQYNLYYRDNTLLGCHYSFEIWDRKTPPSGASTMDDVYFENNVCRDAGTSFSYDQRADGTSPDRSQVRASHLIISKTDAATSNIFIRYNLFHTSVNEITRLRYVEVDNLYTAGDYWVIDYNRYVQPTGNVVYWGDFAAGTITTFPATSDDFDDYKANHGVGSGTGKDQHSTFSNF
jgi:hypothetical protein